MADDKKVIFSMVGVSKIYPPQKQVLKDIYLSFFYGAKIGIIGLNGAGKSTLLKIIAGIDKQYQGEVVFSPGYSVGYLEQDPKLDPSKTVKEIVQEGVQPVLDLLKEFDQVNESFADPDVLEDPDKMDKLINRQGSCRTSSTQPTLGTSTTSWNALWTRCAVRRKTRTWQHCRVANADAWRCADCCCKTPTSCCSTSLPTTSTLNRSTGWSNTCNSIRAR